MKPILMTIVMACLMLGVWGCNKPVETPESEVETIDINTSIVQPEEAYYEKAEAEISDDNGMAELDRIEQELATEDE